MPVFGVALRVRPYMELSRVVLFALRNVERKDVTITQTRKAGLPLSKPQLLHVGVEARSAIQAWAEEDGVSVSAIVVSVLDEFFKRLRKSKALLEELRLEIRARRSDFHFVERDSPEDIAATLVRLVEDKIPKGHGLDPIRDIQVLCPMNRGSIGMRELDIVLQRALNPPRLGEPAPERFGWRFQVRHKRIQTENNSKKEVFNGDIGAIGKIGPVEQEVFIRYED